MSSSKHPKSSRKPQPVSTRLYSARTDPTEVKQSELELREQLRRVEDENSELRYRLDSLRKAKNQLVIKREKPEYTYISPVRTFPTIPTPKPSTRDAYPPDSHTECRSSPSSSSAEGDELRSLLDVERFWRERLEDTERSLLLGHEEEVTQLEGEKRGLRGEVEQARVEKSELLIDFERKELKLLEELERLECESSHLAASSEEFDEVLLRCKQLEKVAKEQELRVDNLLAENSHLRRTHNQREEEWKLREDELSLEIRRAWGQRYHEWITKAEKKMQELQEMNQILQKMVDTRVTELSERKYSK